VAFILYYYGLTDVMLAALFVAKINLSFTAACGAWLQGCLTEMLVAQFAPGGSLPACKGLCCAACTFKLRAFQSEFA